MLCTIEMEASLVSMDSFMLLSLSFCSSMALRSAPQSAHMSFIRVEWLHAEDRENSAVLKGE